VSEPSVIRTERTIVRTGRWLMAFGGACLVRLLLLLPDASTPDVGHFLLFLFNLPVGVFAILTGEGLTRKRGWAIAASMVMGGLLLGTAAVGAGGLVAIGWYVWNVASLSSAIRDVGPWLLIAVFVSTFWAVVLRSLSKVSAVFRAQGSRIPSHRALRAWMGASFAVGGSVAGLMLLAFWGIVR
jgi:hypothetical protein